MYSKFEELCKRDNCTPADVARATGLYKSTFSDWKSGRCKPKADKLKKIADYFGVPMDYLMG